MPGQQDRLELKETYDRTRFVKLLHQWADAIERNQAFDVNVQGHSNTVPADAIERGHLRVEYELDNGEYELELTMKWR